LCHGIPKVRKVTAFFSNFCAKIDIFVSFYPHFQHFGPIVTQKQRISTRATTRKSQKKDDVNTNRQTIFPVYLA